MSELGKCPACGGKIATIAEVCPHCGEHCGEHDFIKKRTGSRKILCSACRGCGQNLARDDWAMCPQCGGVGEVIPIEHFDTRTGKLLSFSFSLERQYQNDAKLREEIRRDDRFSCLVGVLGFVVAAVIVFWIGRAVGFW